ncbi:cupin domain-containing protein [Nitratireductor basaltis]|uniref:Cupin type-2 domain-containing protein n=1 Tax=Nitratireductor basaltis TaxID=472175 RepID=A0A084U577_9HYPH|nr:cupin domain-containing protein [Nitratireductor basaltis]KFB08113.1 hypothetical protein EL18_03323 [Nitratireductor basaltis]
MEQLLKETQPISWNGVTYKTLLDGLGSGGAMSIVDSISPPGFGPPRHIHDAEDEAFVLLTGRCRFWMEGETFERGAGAAVFVPRGKEHTFQVVGDEPCRHLLILTPSGFENFFADMAAGAFRIPEDMGDVEEAAARHNLRFTGPPLGAE